MNHYWNNGITRYCRGGARLSGALLLAAMLLPAGCGRGDQVGAATTPQPDVPNQDTAIAPAPVAPEATAEAIYPAPDAAAAIAPDKAYPAPDAAAAVAPGTAYPAPREAPSVPNDGVGFVNWASGEIGVVIDIRNNTVVEVVPSSPAQAAGIQVGDVITQVEDQPVGDKFKEAKKAMGGKLDKQVNVEIERQGKKSKLSIKAGTLLLPTTVPDQPTPTPILDPYTYL